MRQRTTICAAAVALVAVCLQGQGTALAQEAEDHEGLVQTKGRFEDAWVRPDADLARYDELCLRIDDLEFREVEDRPVQRRQRETVFRLSEEEQEKFRSVVTESMTGELGRIKTMRLVDDAGPATLVVRVSILDIISYVPPLGADQVDVYPSTVGAGTLRFELVDGGTGDLLARFGERRIIPPLGRIQPEISPTPVNRKTMWRCVDRWSRRAASDLGRTLEKAHKARETGH